MVSSSSPARVFAENRQQGSKDLAAKLQEDFGWTGNGSNKGKAPRGYVFSQDFALMHLQWKEQAAKEDAPIVDEAVIAEAVIATGGIVSPIVVAESAEV